MPIIAHIDAPTIVPKLDPFSDMRRVGAIRSPNCNFVARAVEQVFRKNRSCVIDKEAVISRHVAIIPNAWLLSLTLLNASPRVAVPAGRVPAILKRRSSCTLMPQDDALFQTLIATAVDGIMVIDNTGHVAVYSGACEHLFGYTADEVIGQNVSMLMPEPYRSAHDGYINHYVETGEKRIIGIGREVRGRRKDGSVFPMYLSVGEGVLKGQRVFVGIVHDISDRKERDSKIHELQSELLHVTRLTAMGQLASALAHELNQPLATILNYANTAKLLIGDATESQSQRVVELLDKTGEQANRAGQIIRRLREFLLRRESERSPEDINAIVEESLALALVGAAQQGVVTHRALAGDLPEVSVDRVQIQQVLVNLLRNAIEAMEQSPVHQIVATTSIKEPGYITVSIADSGSGMSDAVARRLFEPFVTTKERGMGFGLSMCRSIIEEHGGRIWAEPNPSGGTIFRFRLPIAGEGGDDV